MLATSGLAKRGHAGGQHLEADLVDRLADGRELGDDLAALSPIGEHGLYATNLTLDASEAAQQIGSDVLRQLHVASIPPGVW